ncbi:hypothetical protein FQV27_14010 [Paracoccus aurantiacus]|uniref:Polysaccharide chain length determinant N-terminal domain-containing protein n=1 Tax=Paracoccus aurantiacus TaxID=2599412 RepID=A0A5C6S0C3_9RHOB|nr:Wzz/FepE/Etk N-terminal domain-containing protein [Paracoccus aurantiacus]TXB67715.1 hypothetical protein FQV27_14010 [Paracoccus aurantiacus]
MMRAAPDSFTFWDIFVVLWRNLLIVLLLAALGGAGAYYVAGTMPDRYSATAQLISDAGRSGLITVDDQTPDQFGEASATATIVESIHTPVVLEHALRKMSPEVLDQLAVSANVPTPVGDLDSLDEETHQSLLRTLRQNLEVNNSGRSFVISLSYGAEQPELTAGAANAVAHGYLDYREEMRNEVYSQMLDNLSGQIVQLTDGLESSEITAQTMREKLRLLGQRSDVWASNQQDEAIAENASIYARQREAEREVDATARVYEELLLEHRQIQSRMGEPEIAVQLFSPAVVPTRPSGFNIKPILLVLGVFTGFLLGLSIGLIRDRLRRNRNARRLQEAGA